MADTTAILANHLLALEVRWLELSANPKHIDEWPPAERTECEVLAELVPLMRSQLRARWK